MWKIACPAGGKLPSWRTTLSNAALICNSTKNPVERVLLCCWRFHHALFCSWSLKKSFFSCFFFFFFLLFFFLFFFLEAPIRLTFSRYNVHRPVFSFHTRFHTTDHRSRTQVRWYQDSVADTHICHFHIALRSDISHLHTNLQGKHLFVKSSLS